MNNKQNNKVVTKNEEKRKFFEEEEDECHIRYDLLEKENQITLEELSFFKL